MINKQPLYFILFLLFALSQPTFAKYQEVAAGTTFKPLVPTLEQGNSAYEIMQNLWYGHYAKKRLDDNLSKQVFSRYLKDLDSNRSFFLQSDIAEFSPHKEQFDNDIRNKNLSVAFSMYNRYQQRVSERLSFVLNELKNKAKKYQFKGSESLVIERKNSPWAKHKKELDELWRKRLKNELLGFVLDDKPLKEGIDVLTKRYQNQLNRVHQAKGEDAFQTFMNAIAHVFDPHSQYFSPRGSEDFNINMSLSLQGIGAVLQIEDEYTKIVRLVPAGPADKSGKLHAADKIVGVGQGKTGEIVDVIGWRLDEVVDLIRGKKGSTVRLAIIPSNAKNSASKIISIVRDEVKLEEQSAKKEEFSIQEKGKTKRIGVIRIPTFYIDFKGRMLNKPNYKSTTRDVKKLITELQKKPLDGLIIDLRNNGGGSLEEAISLTGLFIPKGPVVQVRDARGRIDVLSDEDGKTLYTGKLAVMVNRLSASASEIFAGAIQDYHRGIIVGSTTFGKGTVQNLRGLKQGQLKLTQAKFYRVSGKSTQHKGVEPDILFPSLVNAEKIGESALDEALPWDYIQMAKFTPFAALNNLDDLKNAHKKRVNNNPDFTYMHAQLALINQVRAQKSISLNLKQRQADNLKYDHKRLQIENKKRLAKAEKPFKKVADMDRFFKQKNEDKKAHKDKKEAPEKDPEVYETAKVLLDLP